MRNSEVKYVQFSSENGSEEIVGTEKELVVFWAQHENVSLNPAPTEGGSKGWNTWRDAGMCTVKWRGRLAKWCGTGGRSGKRNTLKSCCSGKRYKGNRWNWAGDFGCKPSGSVGYCPCQSRRRSSLCSLPLEKRTDQAGKTPDLHFILQPDIYSNRWCTKSRSNRTSPWKHRKDRR